MKLNDKKVTEIKRDLADNKPQPEIAKKFKISRSTVSDIATGRIHKKVPWPDGDQPIKRAGGQRKAVPGFDPTDERVRELEADNLHLREERDHARKSLRMSNKEHGVFKAIVKEMDARIHPFKALPPARPTRVTKDTIDEHVVLHLSDGHHDQIVTPEESGGLEDYNFPISCRRAEVLVDTLLDWTQKTLSPRFKFRVCTVFAYGDHTSGEIHGAVQRSYFRNQFKNCFAIGQLHGLMYRDLAASFDQVNVVYLAGNHGRRSVKKDYHGAHDNWDYLVGETARMHCRDMPNINFLIPNAFSVNVDVNGVGFNLSHGDDVQGSSGIPFYGMVRRQKGLIALNSINGKQRIRYFCMGHHHVQGALADIDGELVLNGAWVGTDSYAFNRFSGYREPSQLIHGVNPKHGITWRMNVHLRTQDEKKGPRRYKVEV